jgi:hypothetical protein
MERTSLRREFRPPKSSGFSWRTLWPTIREARIKMSQTASPRRSLSAVHDAAAASSRSSALTRGGRLRRGRPISGKTRAQKIEPFVETCFLLLVVRNRRFPVGLSTKFRADRTCTKSEMTATHVSAERTNAKAIVITAKALAGSAYTRAVVITTYLTADGADTIVVVLSAKLIVAHS